MEEKKLFLFLYVLNNLYFGINFFSLQIHSFDSNNILFLLLLSLFSKVKISNNIHFFFNERMNKEITRIFCYYLFN